MALDKTLKTANGLDMNYHKITRLNINWLERFAEVVLYSYQDKAQRNEYPKNPMGSMVRNFVGNNFPFTVEGNNVAQAYEKLVESIPVINVVSEAKPAVYETKVTPAVEEVLDEEGNVLSPRIEEVVEQVLVSEAVEAVTEEIETNNLFGAEEI